jgi:hypothetical protein
VLGIAVLTLGMVLDEGLGDLGDFGADLWRDAFEEVFGSGPYRGRARGDGAALRERYTGLIDRVALYLPFVSGERDSFWRTVM